ncbi:hypothetical protein [Pseudoneobacillus sp. C159]
MGHDISGFNKAGEEIAYARFAMWNQNAIILYHLFESTKYHAGVSGSGRSTTFTIQQIEKALNSYKQFYHQGVSMPKDEWSEMDQKQIQNFIQNCLATAQKEGTVRVCFA